MIRGLSFALTACLTMLLATPAAAADVGVSVNIGQPGFYGRIDIGAFPPPRVIYQQPVVIMPAPVTYVQRPIYLRVPPGHAKNWSKHCSRYNACSQPTHFVEEGWYRDVYAPARGHRYQNVQRQAPRHSYRDDRNHRHVQHHKGDRGHGKGNHGGHGKGHGKGKGRD